jgi:hypothetical protein
MRERNTDGETWGKRSVWKPRRKWNENTEMDLKNRRRANELD